MSSTVTLFLCGDVMTGRGIDQILPHPGDPDLLEQYMRKATGYVELAERANGALDKPVAFDYVWGDALAELGRVRPDARIANLETAVTTSEDAWPGKGIHYRMHPANLPALAAAGLDCCVLANNHAMDWGRRGLVETLRSLHAAGLRTAGAGEDAEEAAAPAAIELPRGARVLVFAYAMESSGVPPEWAAGRGVPGVNFLEDLGPRSLERVAAGIARHKTRRDIAVLSIHWGDNWGHGITQAEQAFAHGLVDGAGVDVVHGHSSHHPKAIEVHGGRPILYGCGDFLNDYEGIGGWEDFRPELTAMYFATLDAPGGVLRRLDVVPMRIRHLRVERASRDDALWLARTLSREGRRFGTRVEAGPDAGFALRWSFAQEGLGAPG